MLDLNIIPGSRERERDGHWVLSLGIQSHLLSSLSPMLHTPNHGRSVLGYFREGATAGARQDPFPGAFAALNLNFLLHITGIIFLDPRGF